MDPDSPRPGLDTDAIFRNVAAAEAKAKWEAEERYLDRSLPDINRLFGGDLTDDQLLNHPLMRLLEAHSDPGLQPFYGKAPGELADPPPRP